MQHIAINRCFGGFGLSREAVLLGREKSGDPNWGGCRLKGEMYDDGSGPASMDYGHYEGKRDDPILIAVIRELGYKKASSSLAELFIVKVPDGVEWDIHYYDGLEHVEEVHRTWR